MEKARVFPVADCVCIQVSYSGYAMEKHYGKLASAVIAAEMLGILTPEEADCYPDWPAEGIFIESLSIDENLLAGAEFKRVETT